MDINRFIELLLISQFDLLTNQIRNGEKLKYENLIFHIIDLLQNIDKTPVENISKLYYIFTRRLINSQLCGQYILEKDIFDCIDKYIIDNDVELHSVEYEYMKEVEKMKLYGDFTNNINIYTVDKNSGPYWKWEEEYNRRKRLIKNLFDEYNKLEVSDEL